MANPHPTPRLENLRQPWQPGTSGNPAGYSQGRRISDATLLELFNPARHAVRLQAFVDAQLAGLFTGNIRGFAAGIIRVRPRLAGGLGRTLAEIAVVACLLLFHQAVVLDDQRAGGHVVQAGAVEADEQPGSHGDQVHVSGVLSGACTGKAPGWHAGPSVENLRTGTRNVSVFSTCFGPRPRSTLQPRVLPRTSVGEPCRKKCQQSQLISAGQCLGFNDLSAVLGSFSPEGRIGKPVFAKRCYMGNFDVTHITAMSSVLFFGFHSTFCIS